MYIPRPGERHRAKPDPRINAAVIVWLILGAVWLVLMWFIPR